MLQADNDFYSQVERVRVYTFLRIRDGSGLPALLILIAPIV